MFSFYLSIIVLAKLQKEGGNSIPVLVLNNWPRFKPIKASVVSSHL